MWWQALPPLGIIAGLMAVPFVTFPIIHYAYTGRPTMRGLTEGSLFDCYARYAYRRDWSMVGNEWKSSGLDAIPDED